MPLRTSQLNTNRSLSPVVDDHAMLLDGCVSPAKGPARFHSTGFWNPVLQTGEGGHSERRCIQIATWASRVEAVYLRNQIMDKMPFLCPIISLLDESVNDADAADWSLGMQLKILN